MTDPLPLLWCPGTTFFRRCLSQNFLNIRDVLTFAFRTTPVLELATLTPFNPSRHRKSKKEKKWHQ
jgi:hypothetical protein